jgi:hypothetical protein
MKRLAILITPFLFLACTDDGIVQPATAPDDLMAAASTPSNPAQGGWEFAVVATNTQTLSFGKNFFAAHNWHIFELADEFQLTGDMEGWLYQTGDWHVNLKAERGTAIEFENLFVITSPGTGTFECQGSSTLVDYPGPWVRSGKLYSCEGTGDYEGMKMKARFTNEANPGVQPTIYVITGVIY